MTMKRIALIMDGWKRYFTYAWPSGILERIRRTGEDVNLYIFNSSGDWSRDEKYNEGEYNIYRLPDFRKFDGIILDLNNIRYPEVREEIVKRASQAGVPVISIASEQEGFYYVGIDNYRAMREVMEHLYTCHGCRNYWFVMGPEDNYESLRRLEAIKDYLQEKGLAFSEKDFFCGSFEYQCGLHGFEKLLETHEKLPQAVVCGNDNIAVGVCEAAAAAGYRVPEDFCVTGFDNFDKAAYYAPRITTVSHIREEVGERCAELLFRIWNGEDQPRFHYTGTECIFWDSCGCRAGGEQREREYLKNQIMYGIETSRFEDEVLSLEYELMKCGTVREMVHCIPHCIPSLKCDAMYLVLDSRLDAFKNQKAGHYNARLVENEGFLVRGYPRRMKVRFAYENGRVLDVEDMEITDLFPTFDAPEGGTDFLFLPMHFRDWTVGYFVIRNAVYLMEKQYLFSVVKTLTNAMENLHKKEKLEYMNQILSELYIKDSMTGMYNRLGYQKLAETYIRNMRRKKKKVLVLFIDLDRLKYINDNYGHEYGDFAIITIAKAILAHSVSDAVPSRTGGDEFILLQGADDVGEGERIARNVRTELTQVSEQMGLPFMLSASIGIAVAEPDGKEGIEELIRRAEELMYQEKTEKKVERKS